MFFYIHGNPASYLFLFLKKNKLSPSCLHPRLYVGARLFFTALIITRCDLALRKWKMLCAPCSEVWPYTSFSFHPQRRLITQRCDSSGQASWFFVITEALRQSDKAVLSGRFGLERFEEEEWGTLVPSEITLVIYSLKRSMHHFVVITKPWGHWWVLCVDP